MASLGVAPASGLRDAGGSTLAVDNLPDEMNNMRIRDEKVCSICYGLSVYNVRPDFLEIYT